MFIKVQPSCFILPFKMSSQDGLASKCSVAAYRIIVYGGKQSMTSVDARDIQEVYFTLLIPVEQILQLHCSLCRQAISSLFGQDPWQTGGRCLQNGLIDMHGNAYNIIFSAPVRIPGAGVRGYHGASRHDDGCPPLFRQRAVFYPRPVHKCPVNNGTPRKCAGRAFSASSWGP